MWLSAGGNQMVVRLRTPVSTRTRPHSVTPRESVGTEARALQRSPTSKQTLPHSAALSRNLPHFATLCRTLLHSAALCCTLLHSAAIFRPQ